MSRIFLQRRLLLITEEAIPSSPASVTICSCSPDSDNIPEYPVDSEERFNSPLSGVQSISAYYQ